MNVSKKKCILKLDGLKLFKIYDLITSILRRLVSPMANGKINVGSVSVKSLNHNIPPFINVSVNVLSMEAILVIVSTPDVVLIFVSEFEFVVKSTICLKVNELLMKSG